MYGWVIGWKMLIRERFLLEVFDDIPMQLNAIQYHALQRYYKAFVPTKRTRSSGSVPLTVISARLRIHRGATIVTHCSLNHCHDSPKSHGWRLALSSFG